MSIRRACRVLLFGKSTYHYKSRRPSQAALRKRIRVIAETRVRFGYRLCIEGGFHIRNKRPKRKVAAKLCKDRKVPEAPNEVWAMGFFSDQLFDCSKIHTLTIVDAFSKPSPAIDVRFRYRGSDVVDTLERVTAIYGHPKSTRVDQGPEINPQGPAPVGLEQSRNAGLQLTK